ncbi:transposase domain-containing protein [Streptomyces sp. NPDC093094]|uniref:transposase domain-containing protein n=1 Tax=Streptomyces sp. NPDC093094 TaxID=3366026 RepID=UPI00382DE3F8
MPDQPGNLGLDISRQHGQRIDQQAPTERRVGCPHPTIVARACLSRARRRTSIESGDLTEVFPPELVDAAPAKSRTGEVRVRLLPPRLTVYFVSGRALFSGEPYREVSRMPAEAVRREDG